MRPRAPTIWRYAVVLLRHRALMFGIPAVAAVVAAALSLSAPRTNDHALGASPGSGSRLTASPHALGQPSSRNLAPNHELASIAAVRTTAVIPAAQTPKGFAARSRRTLRTAAEAGILAVFFAAALSFLLEYLRIARVHSAEAYRELALVRPTLRARGLG
jgi:hypothetical protein